jgi:hypothetical protein
MEPVLYMISFSIILSFLFNRIAFGVSFWVRVGFYNVGTEEAERSCIGRRESKFPTSS